MTIRMLRRPAVEAIIGVKRDALYAMIRAGKFPPPKKISKRATGWRSDEVQAWIESLPSARDSAE